MENNRQFKSFISYYKWHLIFVLLIVVCLGFIIKSCSTDASPDLIIGYIASHYVNEEDFESGKTKFEHLLQDANGDGNRVSRLSTYIEDNQDDINEMFVEMIDSQDYHIYILPKESFVAYKDKDSFARFNQEYPNVETLKDKDGRIYAYSIEGNSYMESLGFVDTDNLFIAAADFGNKELSTEEKNGINITSEIIKNRKD